MLTHLIGALYKYETSCCVWVHKTVRPTFIMMSGPLSWLKSRDSTRRCIEKLLHWQCPPSSLSSERHKVGACSLLMLHSSWNNPTVFQTPKWTPKLDPPSPLQSPPLVPPPTPHTHPFSPSALNLPSKPPTHHPLLLPYMHPLVSCPYLGKDVLSARWRGGRGGCWVDTREAGGETVSTRSPFLIRTCLEFRPLS